MDRVMDERASRDGLSLWELLWCLSVVGVVLALGIPSFRTFLLDARRTADINAFVAAVQLARSEAAKRGTPIVLCKTADGARCGGQELRFDTGWMVFANTDDIRPPQRGATEELLLHYQPVTTGPIAANRRLFEFRAFGWRSTNGTVTFCDARGQGRAVIVSYTGRPRVADIGPGGRALICADLP
jgi:type IV fimbrial biogenesis protein FimT